MNSTVKRPSLTTNADVLLLHHAAAPPADDGGIRCWVGYQWLYTAFTDALWDTLSGLYSEYRCLLRIQTPLRNGVAPIWSVGGDTGHSQTRPTYRTVFLSVWWLASETHGPCLCCTLPLISYREGGARMRDDVLPGYSNSGVVWYFLTGDTQQSWTEP